MNCFSVIGSLFCLSPAHIQVFTCGWCSTHSCQWFHVIQLIYICKYGYTLYVHLFMRELHRVLLKDMSTNHIWLVLLLLFFAFFYHWLFLLFFCSAVGCWTRCFSTFYVCSMRLWRDTGGTSTRLLGKSTCLSYFTVLAEVELLEMFPLYDLNRMGNQDFALLKDT